MHVLLKHSLHPLQLLFKGGVSVSMRGSAVTARERCLIKLVQYTLLHMMASILYNYNKIHGK